MSQALYADCKLKRLKTKIYYTFETLREYFTIIINKKLWSFDNNFRFLFKIKKLHKETELSN